MSVKPGFFSSIAILRISRAWRSSFRSRRAGWLLYVPKVYSAMYMFFTQTSPLVTMQYESVSAAFPARMDFISVPVSTIPAVILSSRWYSNSARLFFMLIVLTLVVLSAIVFLFNDLGECLDVLVDVSCECVCYLFFHFDEFVV